jgi:hypothetical protein
MTQDIERTILQRMQWAQQHPALCVAPYITMDVRRSDQVTNEIFRTCCCNLDPVLFRPAPGDDPFLDVKIEQESGEWPAACHACRREEENGGQSERLRAFIEIPEDRLRQFLADRTVQEFEFRIKFSNFCNLSCRSCSPYESSTYAKITNNVVGTHFEQDISDLDDHWQFITGFIREKVDAVPHFFVHFIGGETLIQPGMTRLLTWMIGQGIADRVNLRLTTAMTVNPGQRLLDMMRQFRTVDILLSIDSVGANYQYIRWPARFEKVMANLETLINYRRQLVIVNGRKVTRSPWKCAVTPVFSLNNIFYIQDWLDFWYAWYQRQGFAFHNFAANLVMQTEHLDVQALPVRYRAPLRGLLQRCLEHEIFAAYPEAMTGIYTFVMTTIDELDRFPENTALWHKFLKHTAYFDRKTRLNFADFNARLFDLLDHQDQDLFQDFYETAAQQPSLPQAIAFERPHVQS